MAQGWERRLLGSGLVGCWHSTKTQVAERQGECKLAEHEPVARTVAAAAAVGIAAGVVAAGAVAVEVADVGIAAVEAADVGIVAAELAAVGSSEGKPAALGVEVEVAPDVVLVL